MGPPGAFLFAADEAIQRAVDRLAALEQCAKHVPDIVVLDALMPELDGFATCERLRKMAGGEHVPVLMLTGLDDETSIARAYEAGATDFFALNNLANLEFAGGEFQAAIARYKQGIEAAPSSHVAATFYYNLSLAHLQRFEYQPAQEARSQADRLDGGLIKDYDSLWKYDKGDYAVVDLNLTTDEVWSKFAGAPRGIVERNRAGRGRYS